MKTKIPGPIVQQLGSITLIELEPKTFCKRPIQELVGQILNCKSSIPEKFSKKTNVCIHTSLSPCVINVIYMFIAVLLPPFYHNSPVYVIEIIEIIMLITFSPEHP